MGDFLTQVCWVVNELLPAQHSLNYSMWVVLLIEKADYSQSSEPPDEAQTCKTTRSEEKEQHFKS